MTVLCCIICYKVNGHPNRESDRVRSLFSGGRMGEEPWQRAGERRSGRAEAQFRCLCGAHVAQTGRRINGVTQTERVDPRPPREGDRGKEGGRRVE